MYKKAFNRLPDRFRKENNLKLYYIGYGSSNDLYQSAFDVKESRDLNKAFGQTLDFIGGNVGQLRESGMDDEEYRLWIKTKIIANQSSGDIPTINEVSKNLFGDAYLGLDELWKDKEHEEMAALVIYLQPKFKRFPQRLVNRVVAGGVEIYWVLTFKSDNPPIYIGAYSTSGELVTVYPRSPKDIKTNPEIYVSAGYNSISEVITLQYKKGDDLSYGRV